MKTLILIILCCALFITFSAQAQIKPNLDHDYGYAISPTGDTTIIEFYEFVHWGTKHGNEIVIEWDSLTGMCCDIDSGRLVIWGDTLQAIRNLFKEIESLKEDLQDSETNLFLTKEELIKTYEGIMKQDKVFFELLNK